MKIIQIDRCDDEYFVCCITDQEEIEQDSVHPGRWEAETRAEELAQRYGCGWETNYAI